MSKRTTAKTKRKGKTPIVFYEIGSVRFRSRRWAIGVSKLRHNGERGVCIHKAATGKSGIIAISTHLPPFGPMLTEAIIHETLHVAFPKATEAAVRSGANLVARVLRKYELAKKV